LLFEVHDVIRDLSSNAEDVRKYKLNAMVLLNALSVLSNIYPIACEYLIFLLSSSFVIVAE
jgi:hypothetical protein